MMMMKTYCVIPDCQVKPNVPLEHLKWAGKYIAEKKPDVIVQIGDFADMASLSSYDIGKKSFEGRKYTDDIEASKTGMLKLMSPIWEEQNRLVSNKKKQWNPELLLTLGNHEDRINTAIENDRKLEGLISVNDLKYEEFGWKVFPFKEVVVRDGIAFSHYFSSGILGRPVTSAKALTTKKHMSCIMGHVQQTEIDMSQFKGDGTPIISLFVGAFYQHNEDYLGPQGNVHHRGIWFLYEVENGCFWPHYISLNYLKNRFGT